VQRGKEEERKGKAWEGRGKEGRAGKGVEGTPCAVAVLGFTFGGRQWVAHNCSWGAWTYIATVNHP